MTPFVGEFDLEIDDKHRLSIPSAMRDELAGQGGKNFYLSLGPDGHLWLYPDAVFHRMMEPLTRNAFPSRETQKLSLLFAMSRAVTPDKQGRVVLPEKLMVRGGLNLAGEKVVMAGRGDHIEIWPAEAWAKYAESALASYGDDLLNAGDRLGSTGGQDK
jgi:MraZ protein